MLTQRTNAKALAGVVSRRHVGDARLPRQMYGRLRYFTRYKEIDAERNGGFKIPLRTASAPGDASNKPIGVAEDQRLASGHGRDALHHIAQHSCLNGTMPAKLLVAEASDLLYHLLVVLKARGVTLAEVETELDKRTAQSGHDEKASRKKD